MDIQMCFVSSPGMPTKMNVVGKNPKVLLEFFMLASNPGGGGSATSKVRNKLVRLHHVEKFIGHQGKRRKQTLIHVTKELVFEN